MRTLTPEIARQLGYDAEQHGVVVTGVDPFGAAADAGIASRDVIVEVAGARVTDVDELRSELAGHELSDGIRLTVLSGGTQRFVLVQGGE